MKCSKRVFLLLFALIALGMVRIHGGDQYGPPSGVPDSSVPYGNDPSAPLSMPFDPNTYTPGLDDFPDPPEIPLPDPIDDDEEWTLPDPPIIDDPEGSFDYEPSLYPEDTIGYYDPSAITTTKAVGPHPQAVAVNTVTPSIEFPRRIWFSPRVTSAGTGPGIPLNCSAQYQSRLLVPESKANSVAVLNTCPVTRIGRIPVGKKPIGVVTTPDGQSALVSNVDDATISVINLKTMAVSQTISLPPFNGVPMRPSGIAILPDGSKAYVADHVAFGGSVAYVIDLTTMKFTGTTLPTGDFPQSIAVTPDGSQVWIGSWGSGRVDVYDTLTNAPVGGFNVPTTNGIAFSPNGAKAYVAAGLSPGYIQVIDVQTLLPTVQITVGNVPYVVLASPTGRHVFVTNVLSNSISMIDTGSNTVLRTLKLKRRIHPLGLAFVARSPF